MIGTVAVVVGDSIVHDTAHFWEVPRAVVYKGLHVPGPVALVVR
jgi:hypothetical protein